MLKMKKILGILLALCFVMSVTAAAASAAPNDGRNNNDNHNGNNNGHNVNNGNHNGNDNHNGNGNHYNNGNHYGKTKHYKQGYWGHKKVRHNPDRHHKSYWYTNDRYWFPGYWYWY
jgi:Ni/Co efflux regulator RcnB